MKKGAACMEGSNGAGESGKVRQSHIDAVDDRTVTDMMEQLQEGYIAGVAATAGCALQIVGRDIWGVDAQIIRPPRSETEQESMLFAHLKCTTQTTPDPDQDSFKYKFTKRTYFDKLAMVRSYPKAILIVMTVPQRQLDWTTSSHDGLLIRRACYWAHLEGMKSVNVKPAVDVPTKNIFDAFALMDILDRLDRGESLND